MPFKDDDKYNENLKKAFSLVIDKAISLGYESIGIPYIGTGANGYSYNDIHQVLSDVMFNYQYKPGIEINILSVRFHTVRINRNMVRDEMPYGISDDYLIELAAEEATFRQEGFKREKKEFKIDQYDDANNVSLIQDAIRRNYKKDDEIKIESLYSPADFIRKALKKVGGYTQVPLFSQVLSNNSIKNIARFSKFIKKEEIYCTSYMLKLNFTQIVQYMEISGKPL
jgi:hypothetical protein